MGLLSRAGASPALPLEFFRIVAEESARTGLVGSRRLEMSIALRDESQIAVSCALDVLQRKTAGASVSELETGSALQCLEAWITWGLTGE